MNFVIRKADSCDAALLTEHMIRHFSEKSIGGKSMSPWPWNKVWDKEEMLKNLERSLQRDPLKPGGEIHWVVDAGDKFLGHLDLHAGRLEAEMHRYRLGMGLEESLRSQGYGSKLMQAALHWLEENDADWLDLSVFAENYAAIGLYKKFGFQEWGRVPDAFRVNGEVIVDVQMSLKIKKRLST